MVSKAKLNMVFATNSQKVLKFFLDNPGEEFAEGQVQRGTKVSKSGTNYAIRDLVKAGLVARCKKGNMFFCSLHHKNIVNRHLKVIKTLIGLEGLIDKLTSIASLVVLYGSAARGEDVRESDIDLFIVSSHPPHGIEQIVQRNKLKRAVQPVIKTEVGYVEMKQKDPYFYDQVRTGIVLWEKLT